MILLSTPFDYLPIAIMFVVAMGFVITTIFFTHILGPSRKSEIKLDTFECGIDSVGNSRIPFSIKYFIIAILFVLFDIEVIFMYPWAVNFKELGWFGFIEMIIFLGILLSGFLYIVKRGALKWED
ncbi:MAG TPA: NADH-quinone oxidoreductase subunit A [Bacteroidia bacterium]|nr:NADH-quinone oxidoreductase subunit A [Bacteroidia bacterium]HNT81013.1 NADH-quinone oxidoreductase subunit A [Bacteroidia bacterium]